MSFYQSIQQISWQQCTDDIYASTSVDVEKALQKTRLNLDDFKVLVSPAAEPYLEQMAQLSMLRTQQRFGKTIQLYVPLYLSNECANSCVYCGFNHNHPIPRKTLTKEEIMQECEALVQMGFKHLLLVTGEHPAKCGFDYLKQVVEWVRPIFPLISIEVQPMKTEEYAELVQMGLNTVYVYQETYRQDKYKTYHPRGKKSNFRHRLETADRLGQAGVHKAGLGALLGLEDWRVEALHIALHLSYLEKKYWKTRYSISFPRLRPHAGSFEPNYPISDKELVQLICAFRLYNQELELSLSTRESSVFRDHMLRLGITAMSAGSRTEPGGYVEENSELKQFEISDDRSPAGVAEAIRKQGYEAVWKDWDACLDAR